MHATAAMPTNPKRRRPLPPPPSPPAAATAAEAAAAEAAPPAAACEGAMIPAAVCERIEEASGQIHFSMLGRSNRSID